MPRPAKLTGTHRIVPNDGRALRYCDMQPLSLGDSGAKDGETPSCPDCVKKERVASGDLDSEPCEACGGCGVLVTSWDTLGEEKDGRVFVDTCDQCTTNVEPSKFNRDDASWAVAVALNVDILLVRDPGYSFKDAIVAPVATVTALLERWNVDGLCLGEVIKRLVEREKRGDVAASVPR